MSSERGHRLAEGQDPILDRLGKLEAWVEVVMKWLANRSWERLLTELDEARGAHYELDPESMEYVPRKTLQERIAEAGIPRPDKWEPELEDPIDLR